MEAIAEKSRIDRSNLDFVEYNTRFFRYGKRTDSTTEMITQRGGKIKLKFINNAIYLISYGPEGNLAYETFIKDKSEQNPRLILADLETKILSRADYWEKRSLTGGAPAVNNYLNTTLYKKLKERKSQLGREIGMEGAQDYMTRLLNKGEFKGGR